MTVPNQVSPESGREERIRIAVEKEMRRRKRLLALYLSFLVVPVAIAFAFSVRGRAEKLSENERVARIENVEKVIRTTRDVVTEAKPALLRVQQVSTQLSEQDARIADLHRNQAALNYRLAPIAARLSQVEQLSAQSQESLNYRLEPIAARLSQVERLSAPGQELRRTLEEVRSGLSVQTARIAQLSNDQLTIQNEQRRIDSNLKGLSEQFSALQLDRIHTTLKEQQQSIQGLQKQLSTMSPRIPKGVVVAPPVQ